MENYEDIINLPHHVSKNHPQMSMHDRAAQFAPFAALTGHRDAIAETARLTDRKIELDEYEKMKLDEKLSILQTHIKEAPEVNVTYFCPDDNKAGGRYKTIKKRLRKINAAAHALHLEDGMEIKIDTVLDITCEMFLSADFGRKPTPR